MSGLHIRTTTLDDVTAIVRMHADGFGPWTEPDGCRLAVEHRLIRPFICHVAELDGEPVGHAEWIVGEEPGSDRFLYLGMIQILPDRRGSGVGRAMLEYGKIEAKRLGCRILRTVPEEDVETFYARCGYTQVGVITELSVDVAPTSSSSGWTSIDGILEKTSWTIPMRIGWAQACATHMWDLANHPMPSIDQTWHHPAWIHESSGAHLQLRYASLDSAMILAWADTDTEITSLISAGHALADPLGIKRLYLAFRDNDRPTDLKAESTSQIVDCPVT